MINDHPMAKSSKAIQDGASSLQRLTVSVASATSQVTAAFGLLRCIRKTEKDLEFY